MASFVIPRAVWFAWTRWALAIAATAALLVLPLAGHAEDSHVQFSRDGAATIIQKDFGAERWSIHHDLVDGYVTGNVFFTDGRPPTFLSCRRTAETTTDATYECYEAAGCGPTDDPCVSHHQALGTVTLPRAFFLPPGSGPLWGLAPRGLLGTWRVEIRTDPSTRKQIRFTELTAEGSTVTVVGSTFDGRAISLSTVPRRRARVGVEEAPDHCWYYEVTQLSARFFRGTASRGATPESCRRHDAGATLAEFPVLGRRVDDPEQVTR